MERLSEEQMWEVIDGLATPEALQKHNYLLLIDPEYKAEYQQYAMLDQQLHKLDLEVPSMRFTENVIDNVLNIKKQENKKDWSPAIYLSAMIALSALLIKALSSVGTKSNSLGAVYPDNIMSFLASPFLLYGFIILNIILFFILLDKKVLKPFFDKKLK